MDIRRAYIQSLFGPWNSQSPKKLHSEISTEIMEIHISQNAVFFQFKTNLT